LLFVIAGLAPAVYSQKTFIRIESPAAITVVIDSIDHGRIRPEAGVMEIKNLTPGEYHALFRYEGKKLRETIVIRDKNERVLFVDIENCLIEDRSPVDRPSKQAILNYVHPEITYDTVVDMRDKRVYRTVKIGDQVWMAENLKFKTKSGSKVYPRDPVHEDVYGRLYSWEAALNACPKGWHLPSDDDWKELEGYLGMGYFLQNGRGWREPVDTLSLKSAVGWISGITSGDKTGFTALPGGYCDSDLVFYNEGYFSYFWTATETDASDAWYRVITYDVHDIGKFSFSKKYRFSVRCIKGQVSLIGGE
jgi:uncharacterized protein (TIGR02145 family)